MNKAQFDNIILENLLAKPGEGPFGYQVPGREKPYPNYYSDAAFREFLRVMQKPEYHRFYRCYGGGKGSELEPRRSGRSTCPPKMASVASSSRFCYLALRDHDKKLGGIEFEKGCPIGGIQGIAPQMDAYIPEKNVYIEVKCHEIFDSHRVVLKKAYWDKLYGEGNDFGFPAAPAPQGDTFEIPLSAFGIDQPSSMFDIKQLICHLLGIASAENPPARLVYLFFKPKSRQYHADIEALFRALEQEISAIFHSGPIRTFCGRHAITLDAVAEFSETMEPLSYENTINLLRQE